MKLEFRVGETAGSFGFFRQLPGQPAGGPQRSLILLRTERSRSDGPAEEAKVSPTRYSPHWTRKASDDRQAAADFERQLQSVRS